MKAASGCKKPPSPPVKSVVLPPIKQRRPKDWMAKGRCFVDDEPHWEIRQIMGVKEDSAQKGNLSYLIDWVGYKGRTWEPEMNCVRGVGKIKAFFGKLPNMEVSRFYKSLSKISAIRDADLVNNKLPRKPRQVSKAVRKTKKEKAAKAAAKRR